MMKKIFFTLFLLAISFPAFAEIEIRDGAAVQRYMEADGAGTSSDPYLPTHNEFYFECMKGNINGCSVVHKFGRNSAVGTSFVPVTMGGVYQTPQVGSQTTLRIKAGGNANDTAAGSGAREVTCQGVDETGALISEAMATAGASASSATTEQFLRVFRCWVSASGTYATATSQSHAGDIVIENGAGGTDWLTIDSTNIPEGQTEIAAYTVPLGYTAYVKNIYITTEASKTVDIRFFKRESILDTSAPYEAMRSQISWTGLEGPPHPLTMDIVLGPFPALTDIGFLSKIAVGTASVAVNFDIILIAD